MVLTNLIKTTLSSASVLISTLANILKLLNLQLVYHPYGIPIAKLVLSGNYIRRLSAYLGGSQADLTLASLKIFIEVSRFAEGKLKKDLLDSFPWALKVSLRLCCLKTTI
jgi:nucleolar pre-ribosomal-associated protein 1